MTKAPIDLQELRRRIYRKAKSDKTHRFWGLFVHVTKIHTLEEAYRSAKGNGGAPGIDGQSFAAKRHGRMDGSNRRPLLRRHPSWNESLCLARK